MSEPHTHVLADGTIITHSHDENVIPDVDLDVEHIHAHEHSREHVHSHPHFHDESQPHSHTTEASPAQAEGHYHHHENTKAVLNRMNRAIGHMESIKTMIESGRDCSEVLVQIAAVRSAINNIGKIILEDHINHCIVDAVENGDLSELDSLNDAISKFVK